MRAKVAIAHMITTSQPTLIELVNTEAKFPELLCLMRTCRLVHDEVEPFLFDRLDFDLVELTDASLPNIRKLHGVRWELAALLYILVLVGYVAPWGDTITAWLRGMGLCFALSQLSYDWERERVSSKWRRIKMNERLYLSMFSRWFMMRFDELDVLKIFLDMAERKALSAAEDCIRVSYRRAWDGR